MGAHYSNESRKLGYHGTETDRYAQLTAVGYNANGEVAFQETKVIGEELTELKLEEEGEGDGYVTHPCTIPNSGLSATENYKIVFHFWAVKADASLSSDYDITQYLTPPMGVSNVKAKYGDLKFNISGRVESGYNISTVKVNYIVGTGTPNLVKEATIDADAETFACEIPYTPSDYTLTYNVEVEYEDGTTKKYSDPATGDLVLVKTRLKADTSKVIYTWTGEGDGTSWTDELNWTVNRDDVDTVGYPGTHDGSYYRTMIAITKDVECIDLKGGTYGFVDDGAMYIAPNTTVKFKNGKFRFTASEISRTTADASGASNELIGSNGGTLIFEKVYLRGCKDNGTESGNLAITPCTGATVVFEGTYSDTWDYYPKSANTGTKIIIRNGELTVTRQLNTYANGSQNDVLISNAIWKVNNASSKTITPYKTLTFRDGPDRQAQIVNTGDLKLAGTYDFALPATPYSTPYYKLRKLSANAAGTIKVDVTNYKGGGLVPLVAFTGTLDDNTKNSMNTITTTASKLKVTANGEDVKTARNAKLVWNETAKTLYFQQDSQNAASIGATEYATLGAALEAAADGATIKVLNDCTADTAYVIANKTLTIDLNGKTIKSNDTAAATDGNGVFWVQAGGVLTLEDSSEEKTGTVDGNGGNDYKMAIWADGGKVVINAGNYVNENDGAHTQYDLIYAKNGGEIVINGGTFKCDSPRWTLNSHNTQTGTFVVTGGKFYQYNPTDFDTDEAVTTWCDAKYRAEADGDWYVIKEGYTVTTEPEASAVTVTADTEAEALEQVEFSVTAPEGIDAAAYENYFKLVATETAEGSKTWIVALSLKDELKPVIAETTAEDTTKEAFVIDADGNVTLNISNKKPGLYYGVQVLAELGADPVAVVPETEAGALVVTADNIPDGNAAFFRVVVDFKPIAATEAE